MSRGTFKNTVAKALSKTQLNQKLCFKSEGPGIGRCSSSTGDNAVLSSLKITVLKPLSFNVWSIDKQKRKKNWKQDRNKQTLYCYNWRFSSFMDIPNSMHTKVWTALFWIPFIRTWRQCWLCPALPFLLTWLFSQVPCNNVQLARVIEVNCLPYMPNCHRVQKWLLIPYYHQMCLVA